MRLHPIGSSGCLPRNAAILSAAALIGLASQAVATAQTAPAAAPEAATKAAKPAPTPGPPDTSPLGRYVARENLLVYAEFAGLDGHADAWKKTAAYRMLTTTSLGTMLEEVAGQVLDWLLESAPSRKLSGAEAVTVLEQMARKGWVFALHADLKAPRQVRGTLVLRGGASKENKQLFGRLMGTFMGPDPKPKIERKGARVLVVLPPEEGKPADSGWVWWPEKDDLVVGLFQSGDSAIPSVLDGKIPNASDHPLVAELKKEDGGFTPVLAAFIDPSASPSGSSNPLIPTIAKLDSELGVKRVDYRWGFEDESLVGVSRLVAPKPRKGALAFFDKPAADPKAVLPVPDGVEYFASLSLKPEQIDDLFSGSLGGGPGQEKFDEFIEALRSHSRVDFQKDFLGRLGPRIMLYMAPGGASAAVEENPPAGAPGAPAAPAGPGGLDSAALMKQLGSRLPRPVLVAEVADPAKFGRALDAVMVEVNRALKARAAAEAAEAAKAAAEARGPGAPPAPEPDRKSRRRDSEPPAPEFRMVAAGGGAESNKTYLFSVPSASPTKIFPPGVKPAIRLDGKHVAFSTSSEAARVAIESIQRKSWTPPPDLERSLSKISENTVFLLFGDPRETTPTILASLPGTLQTIVNTGLAAVARAEAAPPAVAGRPGGPGAPGGSGGPGNPYQQGSTSAYAQGMMRGSGGPGGPAGGSGNPYQQGSTSAYAQGMMRGSGGPGMMAGGPGQRPGSNDLSMIQIKVEPETLPKADDLKALMFPWTFSVSADDETVQFTTRQSFPDLAVGTGASAGLTAVLAPAVAAARKAAKAAQEAKEAKAAEAAGNQPGAAQPGRPGFSGPQGRPGFGGSPGAPGGGGGRGRRDN